MTVTVYYQSQPLHLYPAVATRLRLVDGEIITSRSLFQRALSENATHWMLLNQGVDVLAPAMSCSIKPRT